MLLSEEDICQSDKGRLPGMPEYGTVVAITVVGRVRKLAAQHLGHNDINYLDLCSLLNATSR